MGHHVGAYRYFIIHKQRAPCISGRSALLSRHDGNYALRITQPIITLLIGCQPVCAVPGRVCTVCAVHCMVYEGASTYVLPAGALVPAARGAAACHRKDALDGAMHACIRAIHE